MVGGRRTRWFRDLYAAIDARVVFGLAWSLALGVGLVWWILYLTRR